MSKSDVFDKNKLIAHIKSIRPNFRIDKTATNDKAHELWVDGDEPQCYAHIPRHKTLTRKTVSSICKSMDVPDFTKKTNKETKVIRRARTKREGKAQRKKT